MSGQISGLLIFVAEVVLLLMPVHLGVPVFILVIHLLLLFLILLIMVIILLHSVSFPPLF
jgi:hypothetical protein